MSDYQPIFLDDNISTQQRWDNLVHFIEQWYSVDIPKASSSQAIVKIEQNFPLPQSAKDFLTFANRLESTNIHYPNGHTSTLFNEVLRDFVDVKMYDEFEVLSLLMQAEEDVFWGIRKADFKQENPRVLCFLLNYDTDCFEAYTDENQPSVTAFILKHIMSYLDNCTRFNIAPESTVEFKQISQKYFGEDKTYDGITLTEDTNILIQTSQQGAIFSIRTNETLDKLPAEIVSFLKEADISWKQFSSQEAQKIWSNK